MTVASIVAGFGVAVLVFRIQRETTLQTKWIPWADWLLIAATIVALGGVILPIISFSQPPACVVKFGSAASSLVVLLVIGYPFAILAHYRLIGVEGAARAKRSEARYNPERLEHRWVIVTFTIAILAFIARLLSLWDRMIAYFTS